MGVSKKTPSWKASFYIFFTKNLSTVNIEGGLKPFPDRKMLKLLTFDNLFLLLKSIVEWQQLSHFLGQNDAGSHIYIILR